MIDQILERKRDGGKLSDAEIRFFIDGVLDGSITRAQAAAWLAFSYVRGLDDDEAVALTRAMTETGERLRWDGLDGPFVDKHSTGGVGDKVSLVLAPLWAELGAKVPMLSGRGLGHTGGTLDKLESIPGFRTDLEIPALRRALETVGCFMNGQTATLAPADRILYALRNEVCTVPSIALITASILSKKLSEGLDELVLDVKWGSGAFMRERASAERLRDSLVRVGNGAGVRTRALLTEMNTPLGDKVGHALEVEEAVETLKGGGPSDLIELTLALIGDPRAREVLASGAAYERWCRMVVAHGGDPEAPLLGAGCRDAVIEAESDGVLSACDAYGVARAVALLGGARTRADAPIHPGVGAIVHRKPGQAVSRGEPLLTLRYDPTGDPGALDAATALARSACAIAG